MMVKARKYVYTSAYSGEPKRSDVEIKEEELPPIKDGEYLAEALFISVDPYLKKFSSSLPAGEVCMGGQIAKVIESKHNEFPVGTLVYGHFGWRTHTVFNPDEPNKEMLHSYRLPDFQGLSPSLGLGILGMPGNTAYFGFLEVCQPKAGDTVVVSVAAGAVGSTAGQIARIKGCKVIGFCGSDLKCKWLKEELGFDHAFNYKTVNAEKALKEAAPEGIDCYVDCAGGELFTTVLRLMKPRGRIAICGTISSLNVKAGEEPTMPYIHEHVGIKQIKIEGLFVTNYLDRWFEGILQNLEWIKEGKLKCRETVTEGFDNIYDAFIGMFRGENTGKAVVKV